jgi:hypothetical protein
MELPSSTCICVSVHARAHEHEHVYMCMHVFLYAHKHWSNKSRGSWFRYSLRFSIRKCDKPIHVCHVMSYASPRGKANPGRYTPRVLPPPESSTPCFAPAGLFRLSTCLTLVLGLPGLLPLACRPPGLALTVGNTWAFTMSGKITQALGMLVPPLSTVDMSSTRWLVGTAAWGHPQVMLPWLLSTRFGTPGVFNVSVSAFLLLEA